MSGGIVMVGGAVLLVYLWVTGQLDALVKAVTDAAKGVRPTQARAGGGAGRAF